MKATVGSGLAPATPFAAPVSLLPPQMQADLLRKAFSKQFPWFSVPTLTDSEPDQRGFIIGAARL